MAKKIRICRYCGTEIKNPEINYCPDCRNILWSRSVYKKPSTL